MAQTNVTCATWCPGVPGGVSWLPSSPIVRDLSRCLACPWRIGPIGPARTCHNFRRGPLLSYFFFFFCLICTLLFLEFPLPTKMDSDQRETHSEDVKSYDRPDVGIRICKPKYRRDYREFVHAPALPFAFSSNRQALIDCVEGTDDSGRIGRYIQLKRLTLQGWVKIPSQTELFATGPPNFADFYTGKGGPREIRVAIVRSKSGRDFSASELFDYSTDVDYHLIAARGQKYLADLDILWQRIIFLCPRKAALLNTVADAPFAYRDELREDFSVDLVLNETVTYPAGGSEDPVKNEFYFIFYSYIPDIMQTDAPFLTVPLKCAISWQFQFSDR